MSAHQGSAVFLARLDALKKQPAPDCLSKVRVDLVTLICDIGYRSGPRSALAWVACGIGECMARLHNSDGHASHSLKNVREDALKIGVARKLDKLARRIDRLQGVDQ